jgi:hypothetical protein
MNSDGCRAGKRFSGLRLLTLVVLLHLPPLAALPQTNAATVTLDVTNRIGQQPAVSALNGKVSYAGGAMNGSEGHNVEGSLSLPVAHQFGLQADALYSRISGGDFYGGAGQLFWRDPEFGFLGLAGGGLYRDGVNTFQTGAEGGYYLGPLTLGFFAGVGSIEYSVSAPFVETDPVGFIGRLSLDWYPLKDLRLGGSYTTVFDNNLFRADAEYQTPIRGFALTAEVAGGDYGYDHWLLGTRYYFGSGKPLRDRQRQDDPPGLMPQILHGLGLYGAEVNRAVLDYAAANPGWAAAGEGGYGVSFLEANRLATLEDQSTGNPPPPPPGGPLEPPTP